MNARDIYLVNVFAPETDHRSARTALSVLSLMVLDVLIRGTQKTHAGRMRTDAEV